MTNDQMIVLKCVSNAGNKGNAPFFSNCADIYACQGISTKTIRGQIGQDMMPAAILRRTLETLEKTGHVKSFKGINVSPFRGLAGQGI